jgi:hypothetical protein
LLLAIREYDAILMGRYGKKQELRKQPMEGFVAAYRLKHPRFVLIEN